MVNSKRQHALLLKSPDFPVVRVLLPSNELKDQIDNRTRAAMGIRHRHTLLDITQMGRRWAADRLVSAGRIRDDLQQAVKLMTEGHDGVQVPGIVRREEAEDASGTIPVGFSSPFLIQGRRIRVPGFVRPEDVLRTSSPYQVLLGDFAGRTASLKTLMEVKQKAADSGIRLGVWGSAGLEVYTGLPYTHGDSDLDVVMEAASLPRLVRFAEEALAAGRHHGCRVDLEMDLGSGYGINVLELLEGTDWILGKGLHDVRLIPRGQVLDVCGGSDAKESGACQQN